MDYQGRDFEEQVDVRIVCIHNGSVTSKPFQTRSHRLFYLLFFFPCCVDVIVDVFFFINLLVSSGWECTAP